MSLCDSLYKFYFDYSLYTLGIYFRFKRVLYESSCIKKLLKGICIFIILQDTIQQKNIVKNILVKYLPARIILSM
jgi:hypothetical protein